MTDRIYYITILVFPLAFLSMAYPVFGAIFAVSAGVFNLIVFVIWLTRYIKDAIHEHQMFLDDGPKKTRIIEINWKGPVYQQTARVGEYVLIARDMGRWVSFSVYFQDTQICDDGSFTMDRAKELAFSACLEHINNNKK